MRTSAKTYECLSLSDISQQQLRACLSLTDNHELMTHKRNLTDGQRDWARLFEGLYSNDFRTNMPFDATFFVRLDIPLLPRRTNTQLEAQLTLETVPKKESIIPSSGPIIAPLTS